MSRSISDVGDTFAIGFVGDLQVLAWRNTQWYWARDISSLYSSDDGSYHNQCLQRKHLKKHHKQQAARPGPNVIASDLLHISAVSSEGGTARAAFNLNSATTSLFRGRACSFCVTKHDTPWSPAMVPLPRPQNKSLEGDASQPQQCQTPSLEE